HLAAEAAGLPGADGRRQRALAVVDVADRADVDVRLGAGEDFLRHFGSSEESSWMSGPASRRVPRPRPPAGDSFAHRTPRGRKKFNPPLACAIIVGAFVPCEMSDEQAPTRGQPRNNSTREELHERSSILVP